MSLLSAQPLQCVLRVLLTIEYCRPGDDVRLQRSGMELSWRKLQETPAKGFRLGYFVWFRILKRFFGLPLCTLHKEQV